MKKVLLVLMSLFLFVLIGCGSSDSNSITVTVTDLSEAAVEGAVVTLTDMTQAAGEEFTAVTNSQGKATVSGLTTGTNYKMVVDKDNYPLYVQNNVSLSNSEISVVLQGGAVIEKGTIKLKVVDKDTNAVLENVTVTLISDNTQKITGDTGIVTFTDLEITAYTVKFEKDGYITLNDTFNATTEALTITVALEKQAVIEKGTIKLKVVDKDTNAVLENVTVTLISDNTQKITGDTGIVTFTDLEITAYTVKFEKDGYITLNDTFNATTEALTITVALEKQAVTEKIRIHYSRTDKNYENMILWVWGDVNWTGTWPNGIEAVGTDDYGVYYDVPLIAGAKTIGFLVVNKANEEKDGGDKSFGEIETQKTIWIKQGNDTVYTTKPEEPKVSTLKIINNTGKDLLYVDWYNDYPSAVSPYDFSPDEIGEDWGIKSGNNAKLTVEPKNDWYVYFGVEIGGTNKYFRTSNYVVVNEGEDKVITITLDMELVDITEYIQKLINAKRNGATVEEGLREIFEAKKAKK